jgi:hypothetical protein
MRPEQKKKDGAPVLKEDGTPLMEDYIAVAVQKGAEVQHAPTQQLQPQDAWRLTEWGQRVVARAQQDWPNGEWQMPAFAWKIEDGDSQIPNQKGKKNCDREGFPGHWIIKGRTGWGIKCWNGSNPQGAMVEILDKEKIKTGDYCDAAFQIVGNGSTQTKGMYINPTHFVFTRAGDQIVTEVGSSAAELFGRETQGLSPNAQGAPTGATPPPAAGTVTAPAMPTTSQAPAAAAPTAQVTPATDFLPAGAAVAPSQPAPSVSAPAPAPAPAPAAAPPVEHYRHSDGKVYDRKQLEAVGFTQAHFDTMERVDPTMADIPF